MVPPTMTDSLSGLTAIVPAAGIGSRMGASCPKQYLSLAGKCILEHTLERLLSHPAIARVIVALAPHDRWFESLTVATDPRVLRVEGEASAPSPCSMHCTWQKGSGHWCMTPPGPV